MRDASDAYTKGRFIAHAGGLVGEKKYTNSLEALETARQSVSLIELDVCQGKNGLIVAHDGLEARYGLEGSFTDVTTQDFRDCRYLKKLHPMTMRDLIGKLRESDAMAILDIKANDPAEYAAAMREIVGYCDEFKVRDKIIPQIYNPSDFHAVKDVGIDNFVLALWKNYFGIRKQECLDCVELCFSGPSNGFRALSMRSLYFWDKGVETGADIYDYFFGQSPMIFLHGQDESVEDNLLSRGFGLFSHNPYRHLK